MLKMCSRDKVFCLLFIIFLYVILSRSTLMKPIRFLFLPEVLLFRLVKVLKNFNSLIVQMMELRELSNNIVIAGREKAQHFISNFTAHLVSCQVNLVSVNLFYIRGKKLWILGRLAYIIFKIKVNIEQTTLQFYAT